MGHMLAIDHHAEAEVPLGNVQVVEEPGDLRGDREPALTVCRQLFEGQPAPVADLDGVATATGREQTQHGGLKERGVHAELER